MPRKQFRQLFYRIVRERAGIPVSNERHEAQIVRERQQRRDNNPKRRQQGRRPQKGFVIENPWEVDAAMPPVCCPVCLHLPHLVRDAGAEFHARSCDNCEDDHHHHLYLISDCHRGAGTIPEVCTLHGTITFICAKCHTPYVAFQLIPKPQQNRIEVIQ